MERKIKTWLALVILLFIIATMVSRIEARNQQRMHLLFWPQDNAYVLCANGHFDIQVNGADSIYVECKQNGQASKD